MGAASRANVVASSSSTNKQIFSALMHTEDDAWFTSAAQEGRTAAKGFVDVTMSK